MTLDKTRLFDPPAMWRADRDTIAAGVSGQILMDRAGHAAARLCQSLRGPGRVNILCGPGNNGGDGFVAARYLKDWGWRVAIWSMSEVLDLTGDALHAAQQWDGPVQRLSDAKSTEFAADICVDALFGAGLNKALPDGVARTLTAMAKAAKVHIAVDLPSGVSGAHGQDLGEMYAHSSMSADHTITFGAHKFGHVLEPGRTACGKVWVADIGLTEAALRAHTCGHIISPSCLADQSGLHLAADAHKYTRGHVAVLSGGADRAGAAKLAAGAALRTGAGLVTVAGPQGAKTADKALMQASVRKAGDLPDLLSKRKVSAVVAGPGLGLDERALAITDVLLDINLPTVLDADCLTLIGREGWQKRLQRHHVITPHAGEFARLFAELLKLPRLEQAMAASAQIEGALCLKGPDTIIVGPGPEVYVNARAPAWLATAGSGDVLAGCIGALLGHGTAARAAAGAVYLHSQAAWAVGPGLIADDLLGGLQTAVAALGKGWSFDKGA
ncbi:MAG: NAD(P)H-hydrate dehydratase [Pseudomonadota bacterium]